MWLWSPWRSSGMSRPRQFRPTLYYLCNMRIQCNATLRRKCDITVCVLKSHHRSTSPEGPGAVGELTRRARNASEIGDIQIPTRACFSSNLQKCCRRESDLPPPPRPTGNRQITRAVAVPSSQPEPVTESSICRARFARPLSISRSLPAE